jgi:hypothetical protein
MSKRIYVAAALIAFCAQSAAEAAAPTKELFQQQQALSCGGGKCDALFTANASNQTLDVKRVRCAIHVNGNPWYARAFYYVNSPLFSVQLALISQRTLPGGDPDLKVYTFDSDLGFRVPSSRQLRVEIKYAGAVPTPAPASLRACG